MDNVRTHYRTHSCGELRMEHVGQSVTLAGFLENFREVGANLGFLVLRDFYGTTQVVAETEEMVKTIKALNKESTVAVTGVVRERDSKNPKLPTGDIEVVPERIEVLGRCRHNELPFQVNRSREADESARLKYRYLDLRNPAVKNNIILRSQVVAALRASMIDHGFMEITTPILTASSPEGARDYLVPSRKHPGKFYALPQAPQQFKQLLMASGFDKYFQIAPGTRTPGATAPPASSTSWTWRWPLPGRRTCSPCWRTCCPPSSPSLAPTTWPLRPPSAGSPIWRPWTSTARTSPTCVLT